MSPATRCSSIIPARRSASSIPRPASCSEAEIFVAVLGASNYTYAEASWTQTLPDWIGAHVRMFRFFGGVPRLVVPDNLKCGVHKAVVLRSGDQSQLRHDGGALRRRRAAGPPLASRATRPRSKPGCVLPRATFSAGLRHQTFFSLAECQPGDRRGSSIA